MTRLNRIRCLVLPCVLAYLLFPVSAERRALSFDDFIGLDAVSDPQISPDGSSVAFVVTDYSLEANRGNSDIWLVGLSGGEPRRLTAGPGTDNQPRWSPDGRTIAFVSDRGGDPQIYLISPAGGEARKLSNLKMAPGNLSWSPDGKLLAFSADLTWPSKSDKEDPYPTKAMIWDKLFYRHWDEWRTGTRSHVFVMRSDGGEPKDLTPQDHDYPTLALGGYVDIAFTPDSRHIAVTANLDANPAIGTNNDILLFPVEGGEPVNLTKNNQANDNNPVFSADGRWMAYRAQLRAGFEADRQRLMLLDRQSGQTRDLTPDWQLSVDAVLWSPDGASLLAEVEEQGRNGLYRISLPAGKREKLIAKGHNQQPRITPDGKSLVMLRQAANQPADLFAVELGTGKETRLSSINQKALADLEMNPVEEFSFTGAKNERVHGFLLKPPFFDPNRKYPLVYLIHGGPQGAMTDDFHARWNYQMFAAPGYVVAMVNFHGSTGYGQDFTDSISGHWGDYPYEDLMKGVDHLLATYPFIDDQRLAAAGASYGGYMVYWIATQTKRFKCLISHDGVYDAESMYGSTEELWFPEWEFGGAPWTNRELYTRWSPQNHAQNLATPMLIVHGQLDYRVDVAQGLQAFTALRRQDVPARFLYFPDEGHWVLKPRNRRVWWNEMLGWLKEHLK